MYDIPTSISRILEWLCNGFRVQDEPNPPEPGKHPSYSISPGSPRAQHGTNYDVFINHRGPDIKTGFVSFLEEALKAKGYKPFVDQSALKTGDSVHESLKSAIRDARVHLALFTPGYAESKYCLEELVAMLECVDKDPLSTVKLIPIFFDVTPFNLRFVETGPFQQAFQHHVERGRAPRVPVWKKALRDAADLMGFEKKAFRLESELKNKIVERVEEMFDAAQVYRTQPVPRRNVGLQPLLGSALHELGKMGDNVAIFGICGMGGIGKTTLAKEIYNHYSVRRSFEVQTFLELGKVDVSQLMKKALKELLNKKDENLIEKYRDYFNGLDRVPCLVVIDDISCAEHFRDLIPDLSKLGPGSRIILTSRDKDVLDRVFDEAPLAYHLHEMQVLNPEESMELFCYHAFRNHKVSSEFRVLAENVAGLCSGLPLALGIIGAHLCNKQKEAWNEAAEIMRSKPGIIDVLSISYKGLASESDKMMFLDVSCQMIGLLKQDAFDIWKSCAKPRCRPDRCLTSKSVENSFLNLRNKSLVEVGDDDRVIMHDLLREMGQKMVREELINGKKRDLEQYSHLVPAHAEIVLTETEGTKEVRALSLVGLDGKNQFNASMFEKMSEIHLLKLDGARLEGDFSLLSKKIRWMQWRSSFLSSLPSQLHCSSMAMLDLSNSHSLTRLWTDSETLQVPRLLKVLILQNCIALEDVPENINSLSMLRTLDLQGCKKLKRLPDSVGGLIALLDLNLNGCEALESLPDGILNLSNLKTFSMNGCAKISELPENFGDLGALTIFSAEGASSLTFLPDSFSKLSNLDTLVLSHCSSFSQLPRSVAGLIKLREKNKMTKLPCSFRDLTRLTHLNMQECLDLADVEHLPEFLEEVELGDCPKLLGVYLKKLTKLKKLILCNCTSLTKVEGLDHTKALMEINLSGCCNLSELQSDLLRSITTGLSGSGVCLKYNNDWTQDGAPGLQLVSYYDHTLGFAENMMTKKISSKENANDLCMETSISREKGKVQAVIISVVAHDQGWSDYAHLYGRYNGNCEIEARIVRPDAGMDVEVFVSLLCSLRHADVRDQVYICTLRRSHPLVDRLEPGDKICVYARSRSLRWGITVMQGNASVAYEQPEWNLNDPFASLYLKDSMSSSFLATPVSRVLQAFTVRNPITRIIVPTPNGDVPVLIFARIVLEQPLVQEDRQRLLHRPVMVPDPFRICAICENAISDRGFHCNTCADFDMCETCNAASPEVQSAHPTDHARTAFEVMVHDSFKICDMCDKPISDRGFHCNTCADFDMCQTCKTASSEVQSAHPADHTWTAFQGREPPAHGFRPFFLPDDDNPNINWGYVLPGFRWSESFPVSINTGVFPLPRELQIRIEQRSPQSNLSGHVVNTLG